MKKNRSLLLDEVSPAHKNTSFVDGSLASPIPANDAGTTDFSNFPSNPFIKSKTAHNKMLMRRRKRSQHPLRELRLKRGFTLEELADLTTLSPSYLSRLESGSRRLNADILQRIATILSCHPGDLLPTDTTAKFSTSGWSYGQDTEDMGLAHPVYIKDLPLQVLENKSPQAYLTKDSHIEWVMRPSKLCGVAGAFAFKVTAPCCHNRYLPTDYIFADPSSPLTAECHVLIVTHQEEAFIGQFIGWQGRDDLEFADNLVMILSTANPTSDEKNQLSFKKSDIKASYRLIGTLEE